MKLSNISFVVIFVFLLSASFTYGEILVVGESVTIQSSDEVVSTSIEFTLDSIGDLEGQSIEIANLQLLVELSGPDVGESVRITGVNDTTIADQTRALDILEVRDSLVGFGATLNIVDPPFKVIDGAGLMRVDLDVFPAASGEYSLRILDGVDQTLLVDLDFSSLIDFTAQHGVLNVIGGLLPGDFDKNGVLDDLDIDLLSANVGSNDTSFDLTGDSVVDANDRLFWVEDLKNTYYGDSNLDGEFNSTDMILAFQAGEFEDNVAENSTWKDGDWDGDLDFTTSDFILAFQSGGYEQGPRVAQTVPEPSSTTLLCLALLFFGSRWRNA